MKTLMWKPTLEVLEDRVVLSASSWTPEALGIVPTENFALNVRMESQAPTTRAVADFNHDGRDDLATYRGLLVGNGFGDALGYIEQDNLYKVRDRMNISMGDGSVRNWSDLTGSAEYSMTSVGSPGLELSAHRFAEKPASVLIGLLLP